jgi:hypothetical protein
MIRSNPRVWIWIFVIVEFVGLSVDAVWHGVLHSPNSSVSWACSR